MESIQDYINESNIIKDEIYNTFESLITCNICLDIIIEPTMCMNCQNVYCKKCIQKWSKVNNNCPNRCQNPDYQKCLSIGELLSKLNFNCKKCKNIINYNEMEKHHLSKCQLGKKLNNLDNLEKPLNQRNFQFKKLGNTDGSSEMTLSSKLKYFFIIIYFYYSNNFRYIWSWKNFINT